MQWNKCRATLDHVFGEAHPLLGKPLVKLHNPVTYSYNIQTMHFLVCWNPLENGDNVHPKKEIFIQTRVHS
jgi:hypothetical protein